MSGRIKKKQIAAINESMQATIVAHDMVCPLCLRPIPKSQQDAHHLIPKSRGGVETVILHRLCHRQIHALLTETQLARHYASIEALRAHPELARFIAWVSDKPTHMRAAIKRSKDKGYL